MIEALSRGSILEAHVHHKFGAIISDARGHEIMDCQKFYVVEHQLGRHDLVKITTINKTLLGRQPKILNHSCHNFVCFKLLGLILLVLILMYLCCSVQRFRGCHGEGEIEWKALCRLWEE